MKEGDSVKVMLELTEAQLKEIAQCVAPYLASATVKKPRMRTVPQAVEELRKSDPDTQVTAHYIRRLLLDGKLPYREAGRKRLVDMNELEKFIAKG